MFVSEGRNASEEYLITEPLLHSGQRNEYLEFKLAIWPAVPETKPYVTGLKISQLFLS